LPLEKKLIGTDISTSGFTRGFYNAIEKGGIGMGKTLGDVTGLRDESDQAADVLTQEQAGARYRPAGESPTAQGQLAYLNAKEKSGKLSETEQQQKKELENYTYVRNGWSKFKDGVGDLTGQVAMIALATKGIGGVGKALMASGAEGGLLGGMTRSAIGQALSNETVGLFTTSYLNAFDNYKQQAIQLMPGEDQAAERTAYATVMSSVEALSERIFQDTKILTAFTKGVAPTIKDITTKFITREITQQVAKEEMQKALTTGLKTFGKEYLKSTGQEATEEAVVDIAQGIADSTFGGQPFDIVKTGQQALNTFLTTALYSPLVAGMAGRGAMRQQSSQNTFMKSAITDMAANPAQYLQSVEDLQLDGTITQQEANEKIKLIKSANQYLQEIPMARTITRKVGTGLVFSVEQNKSFDYPETSSYLLHRLNEGILTEQIGNTTDEVLKSKLQKDLNRSQEIRKGLFDGSIGVTPDLKEVIDNDEKADELGIFNTKQVQPDELIGTPFETQKPEVPREKSELIDNLYNIILNGYNDIMLEMQSESNSKSGTTLLSGMSQRVYEEFSKQYESRLDTETKKQLSELFKGIFEKGMLAETGLRNMSKSSLADASRKLSEAIGGEMVLSGLPLNKTQGEPKSNNVSDNSLIKGEVQSKKSQRIFEPIKITLEQQKEATDFANELLDEKVIPVGYQEMAKNKPMEFWEFVAQQAQNVDANWKPLKAEDAPLSEQAAIDDFGETIVNYAKELYPVATQKEAPITQEAEDLLASIKEGSKPAFITKKLEKIAKENGIEITNKTTPDDIINELNIKKQKYEEQINQETIPASEEGGGEEISVPENATEGNESKGDEVLTEQGAEPIAEAPLELTEEEIQKPLEATRAKKVSGALRDFATKIQKAEITGGGTAAQSDITRIPREIMAFAINRLADAIDAGEAVVNAVQKGVDYIREQGHKMDDDSFKTYTTDLISGKKPRVRVSTEPQEKKAEENKTEETEPQQENNEPPTPPRPPSDEAQSEDGGNIDDYEMTTSGEVNRFLSGDTWEDVFGEKGEGDQNYLTQKLSDMLQDGKNMIAIAQQRWGGDVMMYAKPLFQLIQAMSNDKAMNNKKAVLLATFLGELQEAKKRSPERFDAISQIEKAVFAYYQNYMNVRGKEIVAGRLLRLYRDKYIGDIYADMILEKEQVKAKKAIQEIEQNVQIDDKTASEEIKPVTEEEKKKEDKAAKKKSDTAKKAQSKKKKMTNEEAKQRADNKVREIEEKMGKDGRGGLIDRIKEAIKKLNCK
jgi:hypothetical protein